MEQTLGLDGLFGHVAGGGVSGLWLLRLAGTASPATAGLFGGEELMRQHGRVLRLQGIRELADFEMRMSVPGSPNCALIQCEAKFQV